MYYETIFDAKSCHFSWPPIIETKIIKSIEEEKNTNMKFAQQSLTDSQDQPSDDDDASQ